MTYKPSHALSLSPCRLMTFRLYASSVCVCKGGVVSVCLLVCCGFPYFVKLVCLFLKFLKIQIHTYVYLHMYNSSSRCHACAPHSFSSNSKPNSNSTGGYDQLLPCFSFFFLLLLYYSLIICFLLLLFLSVLFCNRSLLLLLFINYTF